MKYHDCDQLSEDILQVQEEFLQEFTVIVSMTIMVVEALVDHFARSYSGSVDVEELMEFVLDSQERNEPFLNDMQRKAYKRVMGKVFGRRSAYRQAQLRDLNRGRPVHWPF